MLVGDDERLGAWRAVIEGGAEGDAVRPGGGSVYVLVFPAGRRQQGKQGDSDSCYCSFHGFQFNNSYYSVARCHGNGRLFRFKEPHADSL